MKIFQSHSLPSTSLFSFGTGRGWGIFCGIFRWHKHTGTALATLMWLWVFYRAKEDGAVVLGLVHPWDAHGHHDDDDHTFSKEGIGELPTLDDDGEGGKDGQ